MCTLQICSDRLGLRVEFRDLSIVSCRGIAGSYTLRKKDPKSSSPKCSVFDSITNLQLLIQLTELLLYKTYRKYSAKCKMPNKYKNQERSIGRDLI